jgi:hypothetical protein
MFFPFSTEMAFTTTALGKLFEIINWKRRTPTGASIAVAASSLEWSVFLIRCIARHGKTYRTIIRTEFRASIGSGSSALRRPKSVVTLRLGPSFLPSIHDHI